MIDNRRREIMLELATELERDFTSGEGARLQNDEKLAGLAGILWVGIRGLAELRLIAEILDRSDRAPEVDE